MIYIIGIQEVQTFGELRIAGDSVVLDVMLCSVGRVDFRELG